MQLRTKRQRLRRLISAALWTLVVVTFLACSGQKVYDSYCHTPLAGWEKNDPVEYDVPPVKVAGDYAAEVGIRITDAFPFTALFLVVTETVVPSNEVGTLSCETTTTHVLTCDFMNADGKDAGRGLSYHQFAYPLPSISLQEGDSLHVSIRHDMKREILTGVSDIGLTLSKK